MSRTSKSEKAVSKYFEHYAEAEVDALQGFPSRSWEYVLVVPAYKESADFVFRFIEQFKKTAVLLVLVINQPESDELQQPQAALRSEIQSRGAVVWQNQNLQLLNVPESDIDVLSVDRYSTGRRIPVKQGVGLARKIGADLASWLIHNKFVTQQQIFSSDADAMLPHNYFSDAQLHDEQSAGTFGFTHVATGETAVDAATMLYEQRLHHYVDGLAYAGSPYAFHTIGSCLVFSLSAYCQVRGFPKKSGGEDFYLLNKLAKSGAVTQLTPQIKIQARLSDRVPFGTGPAVADIVAQQLHQHSYLVYHPESFVRLKNLLFHLKELCLGNGSIEELSQNLDVHSEAFLVYSGFYQQFDKWQKQYQLQGLLLTVNHWLDAFKTLKYIHFQRENGLKDVNLEEASALKANLWL